MAHHRFDNADFLIRESRQDYDGEEQNFFSPNQLSAFRKNAFLYHKRQRGLVPAEPSRDHCLLQAARIRVLEGRSSFDTQYVSGGPVDSTTGRPLDTYHSEYRECAAKQDRTILTANQVEWIEQIEFGVLANPEACDLLEDGIAFGVLRCDLRNVSCQCRIDWFNCSHGIVGIAFHSSHWSLNSYLRDDGNPVR